MHHMALKNVGSVMELDALRENANSDLSKKFSLAQQWHCTIAWPKESSR